MKNLAIDVETSPIPKHQPWSKGSYLSLLCMANESEVWSFTITHDDEEPEDRIQEKVLSILNDHDRIIGHYLKFDYNWLRWLLNSTEVLDSKLLYCTAEAEYEICGQDYKMKYNLADTSERYGLVRKMDKIKPFWDSGYETKDIPMRILKPYCEQDTINSLALFQRQVPKLKKLGLEPQLTVQMEKIRVLADMEWDGLKFDTNLAKELAEERRTELEEIDFEIRDKSGRDVNTASGDDISLLLYGGERREERTIRVPKKNGEGTKPRVIREEKVYTGLGIKPLKGTELKKEGFYKTDVGTLKQLKTTRKAQRKVLDCILSRSSVAKQLSTLVGSDDTKGLLNKQVDGILHPSYNYTVTKTGRLSSSNPNGQNLEEDIKRTIIPRFDMIGDVDLSQLEWVGAAFMSQCPVMIKDILAGVDQHNVIADKYFNGNRKPAKVFNFRMIYGGTWYSYYADPKMPAFSMNKWQDICNGFKEHYHGLTQWQNDNIAFVQKNGWLRIHTGRWFKLHRDDPKTGNYRDQKIKNYPVQAIATADIAMLYLVLVAKRFKQLSSKIVGAVHDSITFDMVSTEVDTIREFSLQILTDLPKYIKLVYGFEFNLPLGGEFKVGKNWGDVE